jgi:dGTPase
MEGQMKQAGFEKVAANEENEGYERLIARQSTLYSRADDVRSDFARDYTRVLHSLAYRRLKHKTQVFYNVENDHICTRIEHVSHVESVSYTIAKYLGLNEELTKAIAISHDLGHVPFGHQGENIIKELTQKYLGKDFWHEQNGLYFVDKVELLEDNYKDYRNLDLTYAVRDGIISHCGEIDENGIRPRKEYIDLKDFKRQGQYQAYTWEGCVVKLSDKIAYLGRDIEDAIRLGFLNREKQNLLSEMARVNDQNAINTTVIIHNMIIDLCKNSSIEQGLCLSEAMYEQLNEVKKFNYENIYLSEKFRPFKRYAKLVIEEIFQHLLQLYKGTDTISYILSQKEEKKEFVHQFCKRLVRYCDLDFSGIDWAETISLRCKNEKIYGDLSNPKQYIQAMIDYIAGMTDNYAIQAFQELLEY